MSTRQNANRQIKFAKRPTGLAGPDNFEETVAPVRAPENGEVLVETLYVSVDPAMRVWLKEDPGYVPPVEIGDVMRSGSVGRIVESKADGFTPGDLVQMRGGWQTHPTIPATGLTKLDPALGSIEDWIGPLGGTGLTAYFGIKEIGAIQSGETVLVSGAAGAVGQMVGQIAKVEGCRVIGIAGGPEKCRFLQDELGFDGAVDYKDTDGTEAGLSAAVKAACPDGVDVYFDNVGGPTLDAALANMRLKGRIAICGRISQTAAEELYGIKNTGLLIGKRIRMQGFIVSDFISEFPAARRWISEKLRSGAIKQSLHVLDGLESAPQGLTMLFEGRNTGKLVVKVAESDA